MKTNSQNHNQVPQANPQTPDNNKRPQNKDKLDSREGEEQEFKGNDETHNKKEHRRAGKEKK
ncbi:hypothetical protein D3C72_1279750 [compost metagenome]